MNKINLELAKHLNLRQRLLTAFPDLADDDPALLDTLAGETDLEEQILALIGSAENDLALAMALKIRHDDMYERHQRLKRRIETKCALALDAMTAAGIKKLEAPEHTVSVTAGRPAVIVTAIELLPLEFLRFPAPEPNKKAIAEQLERGNQVPGATFSNPAPHLTIRRK